MRIGTHRETRERRTDERSDAPRQSHDCIDADERASAIAAANDREHYGIDADEPAPHEDRCEGKR